MKNKNKVSILFLALLVLWFLFILIGYYYVHKPLDLEIFTRVVPVLIDLIAGLGIVLISGGVGRKLLKAESLNPLERTAVQAALGAVILGLIWLLLGVLHLYIQWLAWLTFAVSLVLLRKEIGGWCKEFSELIRCWKAAGNLEKVIAISLSLLVLYQLLYSVAPPIKWDALTYHLQLPRQYLDVGGMEFIPENPYWGHPQTAEMLYTFAYSLHQAETAAVTGWGFGILFFTGVIGFARRLSEGVARHTGHVNAGWMAAAAVLAGYTSRYLLGWAYTDLFAALFGLGAVIAFYQWIDERSASWLRWSFLFAAAAATVKWTNGVLLLGLIVCLPFVWKKIGCRFSLVIQGLLIALAVALPWLVKNLVYTGDPLYPYLIPTEAFSAERVALANGSFSHADAWERILLPFSITFMGVDTAAGFSLDPGPLLLLLGFPAMIVYWKEEKIRLLLYMAIPSALAVGLLSIRLGHLLQPRLYMATAVLFAAAAGVGWGWMQDLVLVKVRMRRIMGAAVVIVLGFCFIQDSLNFAAMNPVLALFSEPYHEEYLEKGTGVYHDAEVRINELPKEDKVLMLWEPRGLYMPLSASADLWIDRFLTDAREIGDPQSIVEHWCNQGYTRVLVYKAGEDRIRPEEGESVVTWNAYIATRERFLDKEAVNDWYDLYVLPCIQTK